MALIRRCISKGLLHVCSMLSLAQAVSQMLALCCILGAYVDWCSSLIFMLNNQVTCFVFTASESLFYWLSCTRQWGVDSNAEGERGGTGSGNGTGRTQTYAPVSTCTTHCATAPTSTEEIEGDMRKTTKKVGHLEIKRLIVLKKSRNFKNINYRAKHRIHDMFLLSLSSQEVYGRNGDMV